MEAKADLPQADWTPQKVLRLALDPFESGSMPDNKDDPSPP